VWAGKVSNRAAVLVEADELGGAPGKQVLVTRVGDALQEPFWPEGLGINRGFLYAATITPTIITPTIRPSRSHTSSHAQASRPPTPSRSHVLDCADLVLGYASLLGTHGRTVAPDSVAADARAADAAALLQRREDLFGMVKYATDIRIEGCAAAGRCRC
jgi:hypothetical protein